MGEASLNRGDSFQPNWGWVTVATLLMVAFMAFASVQNALHSDSSNTERTAGSVVFGIAVLAVVAGIWLLRKGRATPVGYALILVPVLFTGVVFWWLFFLPPILAVLIIIGVLGGGLIRELRPAATPPPER